MRSVCLVVVDVRSAHNVGSLFRTCDGFGAEIMLCGISPRPKGAEDDKRLPHVAKKAHDAIVKTALGAEKTVKWRYEEDIENAIEKLCKEGFRICAIEQARDANDIRSLPKTGDIALVIGNEVDGIDSDTLELCDEIYEIPMFGSKESFNVASAAAVALYQARIDITP